MFELSQTLRQRWLTADYAEKRKILDIVWLNCRLDDVTLCPQIRKPFDALAQGLVSEKGGGGRTPIELFVAGVGDWEAATVQLVASLTGGF